LPRSRFHAGRRLSAQRARLLLLVKVTLMWHRLAINAKALRA
jgi:hypothetical protein